MANTEEVTNENSTKRQVGTNLEPAVFTVINGFAADEDRSISNMISILLKSHPRVQPLIDAEPRTAEVGAV